jgi:hypothetical protein
MYYVEMTRTAASIPGLIPVNYEALVRSPGEVVRNLFTQAGLTFGPMTSDITKSVQRRLHKTPDLLSELDQQSRREVEDAWQIWQLLT